MSDSKEKTEEKMEQEVAEEEKPRAWLTYSESCIGGEAIDPEDRWTSHEDTYREVTFNGLYKTKPEKDFFCHSEEIDSALLELDEVYMVVVRYQDGDTFGTTHGNWHIFSIRATEEEARQDEVEIRASEDKERDYKVYRPWIGYFNRLEGVEIHLMPFEYKDFSKGKGARVIRH